VIFWRIEGRDDGWQENFKTRKETDLMRNKSFLLSQFMWIVLIFFFSPLTTLGQDSFKFQKSITVISGFSPGASTDITTRALAEGAQKELGVSVLVENKDGGGGTVAATLLSSKKPDGLTLCVLTTSALDTRHLVLKPAYDPFKDFTYIISYGQGMGGIFVQSASPFKSLQDLIEQGKKNPGKVSYGTPGTGGGHHLSTEYFSKQAKVKFKHVPFKGDAPSGTALLGGHVDFAAGGGVQLKYVKQGVFRMLATTISEVRNPNYPDVPTFKELGYEGVPPYEYVVIAPKGLPAPIYKRLDICFRKVANSPEFHTVLKRLEIPFVLKDQSQLEKELPGKYRFYSDFLKELGMIEK
jgi:tripartite-type tricarboxylate transporter receptor subunit TctC